jgi:hypothetical protein
MNTISVVYDNENSIGEYMVELSPRIDRRSAQDIFWWWTSGVGDTAADDRYLLPRDLHHVQLCENPCRHRTWTISYPEYKESSWHIHSAGRQKNLLLL